MRLVPDTIARPLLERVCNGTDRLQMIVGMVATDESFVRVRRLTTGLAIDAASYILAARNKLGLKGGLGQDDLVIFNDGTHVAHYIEDAVYNEPPFPGMLAGLYVLISVAEVGDTRPPMLVVMRWDETCGRWRATDETEPIETLPESDDTADLNAILDVPSWRVLFESWEDPESDMPNLAEALAMYRS